MVFFGWKGIDCVREYVIPSNPKSTAQTTQRDYLKDCVEYIHTTMANEDYPLNELDKSAYALLGSLQPTPRTWFNTIIRQWLKQQVAGQFPAVYHDGDITEGDKKVEFQVRGACVGGVLSAGFIHYGTSKTALLSKKAATGVEMYPGVEVTGLTNGTKYFFQYRPTAEALAVGCNSGIYHGTPKA